MYQIKSLISALLKSRVFVKSGLSFLDTSSGLLINNQSDSAVFFGGGIAYPLNSEWVVRDEWEIYDQDASVFGFSLVTRFGSEKTSN